MPKTPADPSRPKPLETKPFESKAAARQAPHAVGAVRHSSGWVAVLDSGRFADRHGVLAPGWQPSSPRLMVPAFVAPQLAEAQLAEAQSGTPPLSKTFAAMLLARKAHASQVRKYTGNPYSDHLGEVAGTVAAALGEQLARDLSFQGTGPIGLRLLGTLHALRVAEAPGGSPAECWTTMALAEDEFMSCLPLTAAAFLEIAVAVAWLHDSVEDQGLAWEEILAIDPWVALGVRWLSDLEAGSRATRKAQSVYRLSLAPGWVQSIKVADLLSNTASIAKHDPDFAYTYLVEKHALLSALTRAHPVLLAMAWDQWGKAWAQVN